MIGFVIFISIVAYMAWCLTFGDDWEKRAAEENRKRLDDMTKK